MYDHMIIQYDHMFTQYDHMITVTHEQIVNQTHSMCESEQ